MFQAEGLVSKDPLSPAFFISEKSNDEIDTTLLNFHVLQAFTLFNSAINPDFVLSIPVPNLRNYFLKRTQLAQTVEQAYFAI